MRRGLVNRVDAWDLGVVAFLAAAVYGVHQVFPPAAWIIGGVVGAALCLLGSVDRAVNRNAGRDAGGG